MAPDFWKSAGLHLVSVNACGWLDVTADFLRAYYTRPEVHPIDTSCAAEHHVFEDLMADPFLPVSAERLAGLADPDAAENYQTVLGFRDVLNGAGTIEGAYLALHRAGGIAIPPVFIDQMVHLIMRNILKANTDPFRAKAGEVFFRDQSVNTDEGRLMLADDEIVQMNAQNGGLGGLGELLVQAQVKTRAVTLDVLDDTNKGTYWLRSDRFDMVADFRFGQPALDAFARNLEAWVFHFLGIRIAVQPKRQITDAAWVWHIGLDPEATRILNALYNGASLGEEDLSRIIALFQMDILDEARVIEPVRGRPVYLGLAMGANKRLKMKPQNLLTNLPLTRNS